MEAETILTIFRIFAGTAVIAFFGAWAYRRITFLVKLTGAAAPNPTRSLRNAAAANARHALVNIFANKKLLRWTLPGVAHSLNSMMWSLLFTASPGASSIASMTLVMSILNGANVLVTRPGAGSSHAHDTKPEQSERYGSQSGLSGRSHVDAHAES